MYELCLPKLTFFFKKNLNRAIDHHPIMSLCCQAEQNQATVRRPGLIALPSPTYMVNFDRFSLTDYTHIYTHVGYLSFSSSNLNTTSQL